MTFLAHAFLAGDAPHLVVGGVIGDRRDFAAWLADARTFVGQWVAGRGT